MNGEPIPPHLNHVLPSFNVGSNDNTKFGKKKTLALMLQPFNLIYCRTINSSPKRIIISVNEI